MYVCACVRVYFGFCSFVFCLVGWFSRRGGGGGGRFFFFFTVLSPTVTRLTASPVVTTPSPTPTIRKPNTSAKNEKYKNKRRLSTAHASTGPWRHRLDPAASTMSHRVSIALILVTTRLYKRMYFCHTDPHPTPYHQSFPTTNGQCRMSNVLIRTTCHQSARDAGGRGGGGRGRGVGGSHQYRTRLAGEDRETSEGQDCTRHQGGSGTSGARWDPGAQKGNCTTYES